MAKKKPITAEGSSLFSGHIPKLYSYLQQKSVAPRIVERYTNADWVSFGERNLWPEQMVILMQNCAPLKRCINTLAQLIAGNGIRFFSKSGEEIDEGRAALQELCKDSTEEDFLLGLAYDTAFMGAVSPVIRRAAGSKIVRLDHLDVSRLRSGELNKDSGKADTFYWSTNWAKRGTNDRYKEQSFPRYEPGKVKADREVHYAKTYGPGSAADVYTHPWWMGCINACEVWTKVDAYNKGQIDTSFTPSVHLHSFTNKTEKELDVHHDKVIEAYTGAMGEGIFHTYGAPEEGPPQVTILPRGNHAGELDAIRDGCERVIYNAYGMPPILMGVDTKTGMDGASAAIQQAQVQVDRMLVQPNQQIITKTLVMILNDMGMKDIWEAKMDPISLVSPEQDEVVLRQAYIRCVTVDEHRERVLKMDPLGGEEGNKLLVASGSVDPAEKGATKTEEA